jgi:hypothetical protein
MRDRDITSDEQVLAEATKQAVQAAGGLEVCSRETGKSTSQLSRCCSKFDPDSITIRDAAIIEGISHGRAGHPHIMRARARLLGYLLVQLPEPHGDCESLASLVTDLAIELGDVAQAVRVATSSGSDCGRDISKNEQEAVLAQLDDLDQVSARLRLTVQQLAKST